MQRPFNRINRAFSLIYHTTLVLSTIVEFIYNHPFTAVLLANTLLYSFFRDSGALGSRLSGAGWGGCTGSLVPAEKLDSFLDSVKRGYYIGRPYREERLAESLFATEPGSGAAILKSNA